MENLREFGRGDSAPGIEESSNRLVSRQQVNELLERYRTRVDQLIRRKEILGKRVDLIALDEFQKLKLNTSKQIGAISGIEIGDRFQYRAELVLIGLHHHLVNGIDYMGDLATSIVVSGHYADETDLSDELIYSGEGSNPAFLGDRPPKDQALESGNLALKNSMDSKTPVRVIRKQSFKTSRTREGPKCKKTSNFFVYDGLYQVNNYSQIKGVSGKLVFQFNLKRIEGQQRLLGRKSNRIVLIDDVSEGKEQKPFTVVNTVDYEKLPQFSYISNVRSRMMYGQSSPCGCSCKDCCSDSEDCSCKVKNGGKTPYDSLECLVSSIPTIHECGPSCNCSQSCLNRVCQRGTKFQFEVFRTNSREWGVKTRDFIPRGRFICQYVGEFLQGSEAKERSIKAEYFFNIGDEGIIDATKFGNVGKFIRRSNSPNLYAKRVFYGCGILHIVFFAKTNIAAGRELTCDSEI